MPEGAARPPARTAPVARSAQRELRGWSSAPEWGSVVPLTGWGQQALPFAFNGGEEGPWRRRRARDREVLGPVPGGMRRPVFPRTASSPRLPGRRAALVCGPWPIQPSRGCGSAPPCRASQGPPSLRRLRPAGPEPGVMLRRGEMEREGRERESMSRESPPPDAPASPSSPSLQPGARDPSGSPLPAGPVPARSGSRVGMGRRVRPVCSAEARGSRASPSLPYRG